LFGPEPQRVVSRDDLIALVWEGRIVSASTLTSRINAARMAIGDSGEDQKLIRTISRKGFRFVGSVIEQLHDVQPAVAPPKESSLPERPAIAVLPFTNMSGDREQEYFSDGISEDIITALSKLRWFLVIARNSSFIYKGRAVHMKQIAEELGVRYVVEGSVRKDGDLVRITAQLNDTTTGSHLWADHYDRGLTDIFAVQDEIADAIVATIEPKIYVAESFRARRRPPDSLDAWDLVMRAISHFWRVTRQDNMVAQAMLEKAVAIDHRYGQAHGLLATSHMFGVHMGWADMATVALVAERAARAAVQSDSQDPWAHNALASVYFSTRRLDSSMAEFELALQLNPNFSLAHGYYGLALTYCGRWQEAHEAAQYALRLSPRDPFSAIYYGVAAYAQFVGKNYQDAIGLSREAIRQRGDFTGGYRVLTVAAGMAGQTEVAAAALKELCRAQPNISLAWIANQLPWKLDSDREHYLEAFRRAGLD
jgi:TolB-like protein/cytochrome c-type biogenesis protein CcmH/NrfG